MPKKDRYQRIKKLDSLLKERTGYTYNQLAEKLSLKRTAVKNYMRGYDGEGIVNGECWSDYMLEEHDNLLGDFDAIFEGFKSSREGDTEPKATKWRYKKEGFSIFDDKLTGERIDSILPFLEISRQIDGMSDIFEETTDLLLDLIAEKKDITIQEQVNKIRNSKPSIKMDFQLIFNEQYDDILKNDSIKIIREAIVQKQPLQIKYKTFLDAKENNIIIHPYLIVESSKRWYVICLVSKALEKDSSFKKFNRIGLINALGLERILDIKNAEKTSYTPTHIDIIAVLNRAIGVSIESYENPKKENLVLKVDKDLIKYLESKPLFPEVSVKIEGNAFTYKDIHITTELENVIFSYSNQIEVVSPTSLREKIKEKIEKLREKYEVN